MWRESGQGPEPEEKHPCLAEKCEGELERGGQKIGE